MKTAKEIAYEIFTDCKNRHRLYPDNNHSFVDYWSINESKITSEILANQDKWISVGERTPEESGEYLGSVKSYESQTNYIVFWRKDRRTFEVYGLGRRDPVTDMNVTHWQPLPKPPKQ